MWIWIKKNTLNIIKLKKEMSPKSEAKSHVKTHLTFRPKYNQYKAALYKECFQRGNGQKLLRL